MATKIKKYSATWFKNYFASKPQNTWTTRKFKTYDGTKFCAAGHLRHDYQTELGGSTYPVKRAQGLFGRFGATLFDINDGYKSFINGAPEKNKKQLKKVMELKHPRARILKFLQLIEKNKLVKK